MDKFNFTRAQNEPVFDSQGREVKILSYHTLVGDQVYMVVENADGQKLLYDHSGNCQSFGSRLLLQHQEKTPVYVGVYKDLQNEVHTMSSSSRGMIESVMDQLEKTNGVILRTEV